MTGWHTDRLGGPAPAKTLLERIMAILARVLTARKAGKPWK